MSQSFITEPNQVGIKPTSFKVIKNITNEDLRKI
jgi:hypothetical protein